MTALPQTWEAAPGLTLRHGRDVVGENGVVRSDVLCVLSATPRSRWPSRVVAGDFVEVKLDGIEALAASAARSLFDNAALQAVQSFFENGGQHCRLVGVCVDEENDLCDADTTDLGPLGPVLSHLRSVDDVGLLCMPILGWLPVVRSRDGVHVRALALQVLLLAHCREVGHRFFVIDPPRGLHEAALMRWVDDLREADPDSASWGAVWYPWLANGETVVAPSGVVGGLIARTDVEHPPWGVHWPPANLVARGVTHAEVALTQREAVAANESNVNSLLVQAGRGVVAWGARTLSTDPRWLHINTRRVVSLVAEQLRRDTSWVVFEHQRPELWEVITRTVRARLDALWAAGLLAGARSADETLVRCDAELNPQAVRDAGEVRVVVLLRPVTTTEQIVVDLTLTP